MKKIFFLLSTILFVANILWAQAPPQAFNYSSAIRGNNGQALPNKIVALRFSILSGGLMGNIEYQETHIDTTDQWGVLNLAIGNGIVQQGSFSNINWGGNTYYLQVELDNNGGTNFQIMGTTQLLSVPYALYAGTAGDRNSASILHTRSYMDAANQIRYSIAEQEENSNESFVQIPIPINATIKNLFIYPAGNAPSAGCSVTATVRVNGTNSSLSVTHLGTDGIAVKSNTTATVSVIQGDLLSIKFEETGGVAPNVVYRVTLELK